LTKKVIKKKHFDNNEYYKHTDTKYKYERKDFNKEKKNFFTFIYNNSNRILVEFEILSINSGKENI